MRRISKVFDARLRMDYGWMFDIQSMAELEDWVAVVRHSKIREEFHDARQSHEMGGKGGHAREGWALVYMCQLSGKSLIEVLGKFNTGYCIWHVSCLE